MMPAVTGAHDPSRVIVGYDPSNRSAAFTVISMSGGEVQRWNDDLGIAVVKTSDEQRFRAVATQSPHIHFVESDDGTRLDGSQWNGSQWNGAQWNGAQWNGAQWNGAQWNGAQWNGAKGDGSQWNGAQWNAAMWTKQIYEGSSGTKFKYAVSSTDPGLVWQWGAWAMRSPDAWTTSMGTRQATLCVLDSGVSSQHPDIAPNLWTGPTGETGYNAISPGASWEDDAGHGTHIAGIAAAATGNAYGVAGVSNVLIMPVKVLDSTGHGHESDLAFGIWWCATRGADVAVMALSADQPGPALHRALEFAAAADVLLLASAGNAGPCSNCVAFPANDPRVIAVSAIDGTYALAEFSSNGPQVELTAPGVHVLSTFYDGSFVFGSGTSQAVAQAAGVAALVRDANGDLTASQVRALLGATAQDLGAAGSDPRFGHGLVRTDAALAAATSQS